MEPLGDEENNFSDVIDNIMNMFGKVMSKDVISAVVESCEGDLNLSVDAIMNMTNDGNIISEEEQQTVTPQNVTSTQIAQPNASAATAQPAQNTGAIPKTIQRTFQYTGGFWTDQIKEIIVNHNQGNRILILMRGVPGSGKSYLAEHLIDMMIGPGLINYKTHILSTDDYFMVRGQYQYEKYKLSEAHSWNHNRARKALITGLSPIIIDNTNVELWEMEPYLKEGVKNGYIIQVLEPKTPWAKKANQLLKRNKHNVPLVSIKRMLDNYRDGLTGDILRRTYGLSYPANMVPPVKRTIPPIVKEESRSPKPDATIKEVATKEDTTTSTITQTVTNTQFFRSSTSTVNVQTQQLSTIDNPEQQNDNLNSHLDTQDENKDLFQIDKHDDLTNEEQKKLKLYLEAQKKLEEIEKVEKEWDNGDNWDTDDQGAAASIRGSVAPAVSSKLTASATITTSVPEAKPQRKTNMSPPLTTSLEFAESLMQNVSNCQDWSKISMFMPPWTDSSEPSTSFANQVAPVETLSNGTCMEIGDTNINGNHKIITATPRNINQFHISFNHEKIPQKRMLDKSSMTNEGIFTNSFRCPNEEKHFIAFRKLFKNIARSDLRDIFDKCCGDVNWSVEIVLDGVNSNQFKTVDAEELSDPEEESMEQCACLANYNIIPDGATSDAVETTPIEDKVPAALNGSKTQKKKRDVTMSDETIQMKRQIEQNVVIADNHYSKHCLKIRKIRRGETDLSENYLEELGATALSAEAVEFEPSNTGPLIDISDDEDGSSISDTDEDVIVTVNLGSSFVAELDERFGRKNMQYPGYIVPRISLPLSVLNEINALWMESLTFQLDEHAKETAAMMQQDEEFARQIAMKEEELALAGKEPEVPDFKEIMDMDMALAVYQKDVAEWRNNMPTDLAAKMTRDKLFNLFSDVDKDTLTELLMAHDNNFNATVEVLLMSTGRNDVLEQENGINKFVMTEEMKLKDQIIKEQKKLDEHAKETAAMMQQDEEFARQIAMKEEELALAGKEPEVPDFKEIMDMDMALAVYQKDVAEWRNNMPTDLAAKMTRDKLFNLFSDVDKDTLTELLMAHDNNFNATVEVLLMSTGRNDVLEQENGINKFVMTEEMKLKDQIIKEQKKELSETEWPLLSKGQTVDLATVESYRLEADNHLARRNLNFQKAQEYIRRGMTQVANYYSELANFHKQKYEYANGLAVASLMQYHAANNPDCTTIDLHYFRVKEARESLDVFIDAHISKLRDAGRRNQMLFFITGRGSHSQGRARIKPATIQRLKQRGLGYTLKNPGLVSANVNVDTKLTYQVSVP